MAWGCKIFAFLSDVALEHWAVYKVIKVTELPCGTEPRAAPES